MTLSSVVLDTIKNNEVLFVDFRFTDLRGKLFHITYCASEVDADVLENGIAFDASSISGWKDINESDMVLVPDLSSAQLDPLATESTLYLYCTAQEITGQFYNRCPRNIAKKAEDFVANSGAGDTVFMGPEPEFFIFDEVDYKNNPDNSSFTMKSVEIGNTPDATSGHKLQTKSAYCNLAPSEYQNEIRNEITHVLKSVGIEAVLHHHEVAVSQSEVGFKFDTLNNTADKVQTFKHSVKGVCESYGKSATFMPKPIFGDNGSGMHVHQSIWSNGENTFANGLELSENALYYIGGIIKHGKALNAFTNPITNSYKRLVPGYEAPIYFAYSKCNRSASIRIPHGSNPKAIRIETRFPDASANPYLAFAALLMAGLDGIKNKIHPGDATNINLYEADDSVVANLDTVARSLDQALDFLESDHAFLLEGGVFDKDILSSYIALKREEARHVAIRPNPSEFGLYYSC